MVLEVGKQVSRKEVNDVPFFSGQRALSSRELSARPYAFVKALSFYPPL